MLDVTQPENGRDGEASIRNFGGSDEETGLIHVPSANTSPPTSSNNVRYLYDQNGNRVAIDPRSTANQSIPSTVQTIPPAVVVNQDTESPPQPGSPAINERIQNDGAKEEAKWIKRHPILSILIALAVIAGLTILFIMLFGKGDDDKPKKYRVDKNDDLEFTSPPKMEAPPKTRKSLKDEDSVIIVPPSKKKTMHPPGVVVNGDNHGNVNNVSVNGYGYGSVTDNVPSNIKKPKPDGIKIRGDNTGNVNNVSDYGAGFGGESGSNGLAAQQPELGGADVRMRNNKGNVNVNNNVSNNVIAVTGKPTIMAYDIKLAERGMKWVVSTCFFLIIAMIIFTFIAFCHQQKGCRCPNTDQCCKSFWGCHDGAAYSLTHGWYWIFLGFLFLCIPVLIALFAVWYKSRKVYAGCNLGAGIHTTSDSALLAP